MNAERVRGEFFTARSGIERCISWTGCPCALACWHYLTEQRGRVTALCRACGAARAKRSISDARERREEKP